MKVLVTGGAGYIGSFCCKALLDKGYGVIVVDNLSKGHKHAIDSRAIFYEGDICDEPFLNAVFNENKIDCVFHFAAASLVGESIENPSKYFKNNVFGTINLLNSMQKHNIKYIVFSSSAAVYGDAKHFPIEENEPTKPTNPYGESKLMMENIMSWMDKCYGIKYVALRYFNVAGASLEIGEEHNPETHLIPLVLHTILGKKECLEVYGNDYPTEDGTCIRDYIHIDDLINAHLLAYEYLKKNNTSNVFNLGSEKGFSVLQIINSAEQVTSKKCQYKIANRRPGDPAILVASSKKAQDVLGWKRDHNDIKDSIKSAYDFYQKHIK